jgi:hydrogenase maturation protease
MKLVIGCGNTDRGDDRAGILVARLLRTLGWNAIEHCGDGLALIELWHGFDDVVVVDAIMSGAEPGSVATWDPVSSLCVPANWHSSGHVFGPAEAIELARVIGRLPERIRIYEIEGEKFEPGAAPSGEVMEAVDRVGRKIANEISAN